MFLVDLKTNKEEVQLQLSKLNGKLGVIKENKIENFTILSNKKEKYISQKRMRNKEIIFIRGLQNFYKYNVLNPNEIKIEEDFQ